MAGFDVPQQFCRQDEAEEDVDGEQEFEVWHVVAQWWSALVFPAIDHPCCCFGDAEEGDSEAEEPFLVHIIDDHVSEMLCFFECFGFSPRSNSCPDGLYTSNKSDKSTGTRGLKEPLELFLDPFLNYLRIAPERVFPAKVSTFCPCSGFPDQQKVAGFSG
jgi:hypothetical protein